MIKIDKTSMIDSKAEIADNVTIYHDVNIDFISKNIYSERQRHEKINPTIWND